MFQQDNFGSQVYAQGMVQNQAQGYGGQADLMDPNNARQLWLGNLQAEVTPEDLCNVVRGGLVINVKLMIEKHCAFVTFADPLAAVEFFNFAMYSGVSVKGRRIKIGWGKPTPLTDRMSEALQRGATRNIYLGGIDPAVDEDRLRQDFSEFGEIEQIHIIREKNTGFVNFTSLLNAVSAFERIQRNPQYTSCSIRFGKDRCTYPLRANQRPQFGQNNYGNNQNTYQQAPIDQSNYGQDLTLNPDLAVMPEPYLQNAPVVAQIPTGFQMN